MKLKKLLAAVVTGAMVAAMSVGAFAAEASNPNNAQTPVNGKVSFTKTYKLKGEGTSPAETFKFSITNAGVSDAATGVTTETMPTPTVGTAEYEGGEATAAGTQKSVDITLPTYNSVGYYTYTLKETAGTKAGVTYDGSEYTVKVTVINGGDGGYEVSTVSFSKNGEKVDKNLFTNTYTANSLSVKKNVTGNLGDKSKYFKFTVALEGKEGKTYASSYTITGGTNAANDASVTVSGTATVYLKDGETIKIENLPEGVTYTVSEVKEDYTQTTNGKEKGVTTGEAVTAEFTNNKGGQVDTGINLDTIPYIVAIAAVAFAAVALFIARKNRVEL